jgi:tetratricopeptide (TPR) repeat protein
MSKNYSKAEKMYARVVELKPDYLDEAHFNLALVQSKLDKNDESVANIQKAVQINPKNELAQYYLKKLKGGPAE